MAIARFGGHARRSYGFCVKLTAVAILGLCFIFVWSVFSPSSSSSVTSQRSAFNEIAEPVSIGRQMDKSYINPSKQEPEIVGNQGTKKSGFGSDLVKEVQKKVNVLAPSVSVNRQKNEKAAGNNRKKGNGVKLPEEVGEVKTERDVGPGDEEGQNEKGKDKNLESKEEEEKEEENTEDGDLANGVDVTRDDENDRLKGKGNKKTKFGPLFDPKVQYSWKLCSTRSKYNYIPCIDIESASGRTQSYRHHERSCPKNSLMCLVPLPREGYGTPVRWPESKSKILYGNVAHPKLAAFIMTQNWVVESGEYLTFPHNRSVLKGGIEHYLESIKEMVPDIVWGKDIRCVLDIGCSDSSFGSSLIEKDVFTLTLGLKDDLVDLAQVALERGFPAILSPFGTRRLPFPSGVFDTIHCGECSISWHSNGGKLLFEMNRILRPGGYFILSSKHDSIEEEEAMTKLTASICWNILAHKTDELSDIGVKIYQKPESNDIYILRRKKIPPMCQENEKPDAAWYVPMKTCLHAIPSAIEERGTEWPEEWPKRLNTFPDWMSNREKLILNSENWKAVVEESYLPGIGVDWSTVRNVMDMKAIDGGFAAALSQQKVWVMNVIPVHAPDTLPIIFERGLVGVYHDWCEPFGTYPRSYDLLHADHLFSRLKNRCKQPVTIVVEMDRILRPSGWAIVRDKVETLNPLQEVFKSLHWEIRTTFAQDKEGILCVQKSAWRP